MKKIRSFFVTIVSSIKSFPKKFKKEKKPLLIETKDENNLSTDNLDTIDKNAVDLKVKFKKQRFPRVFVSSKRGNVSTAAMIIVPLAIAITGATFGIITANKNKPTKEVSIVTNKDSRRVYLLANDNYVVPLTIKAETKLTVQEEMLEVFNLLKVDTKLKSTSLRGYIPKDASIKRLVLEDGELTLDFNQQFLAYEEKSELRMLESLVHTFLEFKDVKLINFAVDGTYLTKMPKFNTLVSNSYTRNYGINKALSSAADLDTKERVVVYYQKSYDANDYLVPVSVLATRGNNRVETVYNGMKVKQSLVTGLKPLKEYECIDLTVMPTFDGDALNISVNDMALLDEVTVKRTVFEVIRLTLDFLEVDLVVNLSIEGEVYAVDGYYEQQVVEVSSIDYNGVAI